MDSSAKPTLLLLICVYFLLPLVWSQVQDPCETTYHENFTCRNTNSRRSILIAEDSKDCGGNMVETTLKLFAEGEEVIKEQFKKFGNRQEAVLMIGKTGTGKSTLTYFLAGNNSAMVSIENNLGRKQIKDCNGKIGESVIVSQTTFPELVINPKSSTAFFDYPGFFDTRPACVEIANAYFMLTVSRKVPKAKLVIAVDHAAVYGDSKGSIIETLVSIINFIPNIESYAGGIGLFATKVSADLQNKADNQVEKFIQNYLRGVKTGLNETLQGNKLRKATFIVDQLLLTGRIGPFRTPPDCGPLSDISYMQSNKEYLSNVIIKNLKYINTNENDFNMSLSGSAELALKNLGESLTSNITASLQKFRATIVEAISKQVSCQNLDSCTKLLPSLQSLYANKIFLEGYTNILYWKGFTFVGMIGNVTNVFSNFPGVVVSESLLGSMKLNAGYLDFIQSLTTKTIDVSQWTSPLKDMKADIENKIKITLKTSIDKMVTDTMATLFEASFTSIVTPFKNLNDIYSQQKLVDSTLKAIESIKENITITIKTISLSKFVGLTIINVKTLKLPSSDPSLKNLESLVPIVIFLEKTLSISIIPPTEQPNWLKFYTDLESWVTSEQNWCNFVIAIFDELARKEYHIGNKVGMKSWWNDKMGKRFEYSDSNQSKLTILYQGFKAVFYTPIQTEPNVINILKRETTAKVETLNLLLATVLENSLTCKGTATTICEGKFVSLKEVRAFTTKTQTKSIVVKSMHSVYLDDELKGADWNNGSNLNVIILAPTWITVNSINLNGRTGLTPEPIISPTGLPGIAGYVGYNGGNFYGIGQNFPEGNPVVLVDGGTGGTGQLGQPGKRGGDGAVKEVSFDKGNNKISSCDAWKEGKVLLKGYNPFTCTPPHEDGGGACKANDNGAQHLVEGYAGQTGGTGGAGGKGGLGGLGGNTYLKNAATSVVKDSTGSYGAVGGLGFGGKGGDGGKKGDTYEIYIDDAKGATGKWCKHISHRNIPVSTRASSGSTGETGKSNIQPGARKPTYPPFSRDEEAKIYKGQFEAVAKTLISNNKFFKTPLADFVAKMK